MGGDEGGVGTDNAAHYRVRSSLLMLDHHVDAWWLLGREMSRITDLTCMYYCQKLAWQVGIHSYPSLCGWGLQASSTRVIYRRALSLTEESLSRVQRRVPRSVISLVTKPMGSLLCKACPRTPNNNNCLNSSHHHELCVSAGTNDGI